MQLVCFRFSRLRSCWCNKEHVQVSYVFWMSKERACEGQLMWQNHGEHRLIFMQRFLEHRLIFTQRFLEQCSEEGDLCFVMSNLTLPLFLLLL